MKEEKTKDEKNRDIFPFTDCACMPVSKKVMVKIADEVKKK